MTAEIEIVIETLGAQADGMAQTPQGPLYVPYVLPGERVLARPVGGGRAELVRMLEASGDRIAPACPHFTLCGGCSLQHMEALRYADWKRAQVAAALRARGIEVDIAPLVPARPHSRRRATFAATRTKKTLAVGYYAQASHTIVPIADCRMPACRIGDRARTAGSRRPCRTGPLPPLAGFGSCDLHGEWSRYRGDGR